MSSPRGRGNEKRRRKRVVQRRPAGDFCHSRAGLSPPRAAPRVRTGGGDPGSLTTEDPARPAAASKPILAPRRQERQEDTKKTGKRAISAPSFLRLFSFLSANAVLVVAAGSAAQTDTSSVCGGRSAAAVSLGGFGGRLGRGSGSVRMPLLLSYGLGPDRVGLLFGAAERLVRASGFAVGRVGDDFRHFTPWKGRRSPLGARH